MTARAMKIDTNTVNGIDTDQVLGLAGKLERFSEELA